VPERRLPDDAAECIENVGYERQGETAQQHGARRDRFVPWLFRKASSSKQVSHQR
jgi:hypothetical protein